MISDSEFARRLYYEHEDYAETNLTKKRFKHSDIISLINRIKTMVNVNILNIVMYIKNDFARPVNFMYKKNVHWYSLDHI